MALSRGPREGVCAARDCEENATLIITWTNPKNPRARSKTWLACEAHREFLADYMRYRGFPFEISPIIADADN